MARFYAQLCSVLFLVAGVGGLALGNAGAVANGSAGGNLGSITLHLTWARDAIDIALMLVFGYVAFFAGRRSGRWIVGGAGVFLLALGLVGFIVGDNPQASRSIAGLNFPWVVNIVDTVIGVLGILAALGTLDEDSPAEPRSILRAGS